MAVNLSKIRPFTKEPFDEALGNDTNDFLKWVQATLNTLVGQQIPPGVGFNATQNPIISPAGSGLSSLGSRSQSVTTAIVAVPSSTSISFFWDGTNGSTPLTIYRDDGTIAVLGANSITVSGLTPSTTYFFYPFYQEIIAIGSGGNFGGEVAGVQFTSVPGAVGTPPIAYTVKTPRALATQISRDHVPLSLNFPTNGIATTAAGTGASVSGGSGGGGSFGGVGKLLP